MSSRSSAVRLWLVALFLFAFSFLPFSGARSVFAAWGDDPHDYTPTVAWSVSALTWTGATTIVTPNAIPLDARYMYRVDMFHSIASGLNRLQVRFRDGPVACPPYGASPSFELTDTNYSGYFAITDHQVPGSAQHVCLAAQQGVGGNEMDVAIYRAYAGVVEDGPGWLRFQLPSSDSDITNTFYRFNVVVTGSLPFRVSFSNLWKYTAEIYPGPGSEPTVNTSNDTSCRASVVKPSGGAAVPVNSPSFVDFTELGTYAITYSSGDCLPRIVELVAGPSTGLPTYTPTSTNTPIPPTNTPTPAGVTCNQYQIPELPDTQYVDLAAGARLFAVYGRVWVLNNGNSIEVPPDGSNGLALSSFGQPNAYSFYGDSPSPVDPSILKVCYYSSATATATSTPTPVPSGCTLYFGTIESFPDVIDTVSRNGALQYRVTLFWDFGDFVTPGQQQYWSDVRMMTLHIFNGSSVFVQQDILYPYPWRSSITYVFNSSSWDSSFDFYVSTNLSQLQGEQIELTFCPLLPTATPTQTATRTSTATATATATPENTPTVVPTPSPQPGNVDCAVGPVDGLDCTIADQQQTQIALQKTQIQLARTHIAAGGTIVVVFPTQDVGTVVVPSVGTITSVALSQSNMTTVQAIICEKDPCHSLGVVADALSDTHDMLGQYSTAPSCEDVTVEFPAGGYFSLAGADISTGFCFVVDHTTVVRQLLRALSVILVVFGLFRYYRDLMRRLGDV